MSRSVLKRSLGTVFVGLLAVGISAAGWAHGPATKLHGPVTAAEKQAFGEARPAFERHCFRCHSKDARKPNAKALAHVDMTSYPFGGHHAGMAGAAVLTALGLGPEHKKATMPPDQPGTVPAEDLRLIQAWAAAFAAAHG